jgi:hypothetical protein
VLVGGEEGHGFIAKLVRCAENAEAKGFLGVVVLDHHHVGNDDGIEARVENVAVYLIAQLTGKLKKAASHNILGGLGTC